MKNTMQTRRRSLLIGLVAGLLGVAGDGSLARGQGMSALQVDLAGATEGPVAKELAFVVEGVWTVASKDGQKALRLDPVPITDANAQVGPSAKGAAWISAKVFASKKARSFPRFGISLHGMSGYRLLVNGARKQVELVKSDEVVATAPLVWTSDAWVTLKLEAKQAADGGAWTIAAYVVADGTPVGEPLLKHTDESKMKGSGKCGLWATPYSEQPVWFAEIQGEVQTGE
jgi:hypothetical protein